VPVRVSYDANTSTVLYNAMIHPFLPYGIKGAIWYQGESNAPRAYQYRELLATMITDWRTRWQQGDFPFLIVQLANYLQGGDQPREDSWAELRESQNIASKKVGHSAVAVIIDSGDANDIHPKDKQIVGYRLAHAAYATAYGQKGDHLSPLYQSMTVKGNEVVLAFDHVGKGLTVKGAEIKGFAIAGADRKFVWAKARIEGKQVIVWSPEVSKPVAVRYAWDINPTCNLYNEAGFPVSPFRTDSWPGVTVNNH
jgi:sialate O-acetylesterase